MTHLLRDSSFPDATAPPPGAGALSRTGVGLGQPWLPGHQIRNIDSMAMYTSTASISPE